MYSGIGELLSGRPPGDGATSECSSIAPLPGGGGAVGLPRFVSGDGCDRGWLGGWVRSGGGAECADGGQKASEQEGEGGDHEGFGAGGEACSFAERADRDGCGGPAGRAGFEGGDAEQGDADVAEQGERLDGGDGAGVYAFEHRRGLGVAESAGDGGSGGRDAVLEQDDQRAEDAEHGAGGGQPRGAGGEREG